MNIADEIKRLHELHQAGALSEIEYDAAKRLAMENYRTMPERRKVSRDESKQEITIRKTVHDGLSLKVKFEIFAAVLSVLLVIGFVIWFKYIRVKSWYECW